VSHSEFRPELLAPAGNWDCARAAVATGADAIYFGLSAFNARMRAENFTTADLPELADFLHRNGVKGYVTMNTLIFTGELAEAETQLRAIQESGMDGVIIQDLGLAKLTRLVAPDVEVRGSTQMTITSPEGLAFVEDQIGLGCAVLARELSLREITRFAKSSPTGQSEVPLEVFVHGALCVAYSGQCLTSESLGQRSANRGECAQACRMPYQLVVDGVDRDLGDQRYLLSPQDLAAVDLLPDLIDAGVSSFKIEGRLKSPEYVAAVTGVYRKAIDSHLGLTEEAVDKTDRYALEMTFSRGLSTGWLEGSDHPKLTHGRFGKKRGAHLGTIRATGSDWIEVDLADTELPLKAGDGIVIATGVNTDHEPGGRIWQVDGNRLSFERGRIPTSDLAIGADIWKTDDPHLNKQIRKSWQNAPEATASATIDLKVHGEADSPLVVEVVDHSGVSAESDIDLQAAKTRPLDQETLVSKLGRLGGTGWELGSVEVHLKGDVMLPVSALNRIRRDLVEQLGDPASGTEFPPRVQVEATHTDLLPKPEKQSSESATLHVLCRTPEQIDAALEVRADRIYVDFEDVRRMSDAVEQVRSHASPVPVFLATPRIQKSGEAGLFRLLERAEPDGILVRNLGGLEHFRHGDHGLELAGDFSLNVANPLTARLFKEAGLGSLAISHDLNAEQVLALISGAPPQWFEFVVHHHMPMFHMEHCTFCAFLSDGRNYLDCGRPCDNHKVQLRDRVGQLHTLKADVGCRNTLFNGRAQTGAAFLPTFRKAGLQQFRLELLDQDKATSLTLLESYHQVLRGIASPEHLSDRVNALEMVGVVKGTLEM